MRDFAAPLYKSKAWQECRDGYARSVGGLCERCLARGIYRAGEIVHHKIHLTPENVGDPRVALAWENLELLCRDCHGAEHKKNKKRYTIGENGEVITGEPPRSGPPQGE